MAEVWRHSVWPPGLRRHVPALSQYVPTHLMVT